MEKVNFLKHYKILNIVFLYFFIILIWVLYYFIDADYSFNYNENIFVLDWHKELQYLSLIKSSLSNLIVPFHVPNLPEFGFTNKFLGTPIYTLFFHSFGLLFLSEFKFHLINHLIFYSLGFLGCLLFKKRYSLTFISFFFLTLTFNLYGGFITKVSSYGPSMLGYYMIPLIFYYFIKISENENDDINNNLLYIVLFSLSLSLVMMNGSLHYFVQLLTFIIFWFIFNLRKFKIFMLIGIFTFLLLSYKVLPASLVFGIEGNIREVHGYTLNPEFFLQTFISIRGILDTGLFMSKNNPFGYQEYSNYISIVGLMVIFVFGITHYLISNNSRVKIKSFILPICILFICAFENFRLYIIPDFLPLLNAESRTMGYISIIFLILLFISTINLDQWYKRNISIKVNILCIFSMLVHTFYLFLNIFFWRIQYIQNLLVNDPRATKEFSGNKILTSTKLFINNDYSDTIYIYSFYCGLFITILTIILISAFLIIRFDIRKKTFL